MHFRKIFFFISEMFPNILIGFPKIYYNTVSSFNQLYLLHRRRGRRRMVVGFTTTCAISAYHH
jgi:hypothetical protein